MSIIEQNGTEEWVGSVNGLLKGKNIDRYIEQK